MRRDSLVFQFSTLLALALGASSGVDAQKYYYDDAEGSESCRPIWREYGRSMSGRPRAVYCEVRDIGVLPRTETIRVDGGNRSGVKVSGARRSDARVRLVVQAQGRSVADAKARAAEVKLDLREVPLRITGLGIVGRDRFDHDDEDDYVFATIAIDAPEQSNLTLDVTKAPLEVENVSGRMDLHASYGPITLRGIGGDVRARVDYGPILVELAGDKWSGTRLDAESQYGPVTLRVPRNFGAELSIGAEHGPIDIEFPLTLRRFDASLIETKLGDGGPPVRAVARYGPMSLKVAR